jgi:excisionase family DNA binding protein
MESPSADAEFLTVPEVATLLRVVDKTVYTMAQRAELPAFKVRGQWRFRRLDINTWIDAQVAQRSGLKDHLLD